MDSNIEAKMRLFRVIGYIPDKKKQQELRELLVDIERRKLALSKEECAFLQEVDTLVAKAMKANKVA